MLNEHEAIPPRRWTSGKHHERARIDSLKFDQFIRDGVKPGKGKLCWNMGRPVIPEKLCPMRPHAVQCGAARERKAGTGAC